MNVEAGLEVELEITVSETTDDRMVGFKLV
jgi:hypothetical protein